MVQILGIRYKISPFIDEMRQGTSDDQSDESIRNS